MIILILSMNITYSTANRLEKESIKTRYGITLYVGGSGPGNYTTIQEAIANASNGDTVFVYTGIYSANIIVDKTITLVGENQDNTIIEGERDGILVYADHVKISRFTIQKCGGFWHHSGIYLSSDHNIISNVSVVNNEVINGIFMENAYDNLIIDNIIKNNNYYAIRLDYSSYNKIVGNFVSDIITNGISLTESLNNEIYKNTLKTCSLGGISICCNSENNKIYHNNLINNSLNNAYDACNNIWDDSYPSGGNYWDDYTGIDADGDGIGDIPYDISGGLNEDRYPLMNPCGSPTAPEIYGPVNGKVGESYEYSFESTDPEKDQLYYFVDWDDGSNTDWIGPFNSGDTVIINHTFTNKGTFKIKAISKDINELESKWGELTVSIPKCREIKNNYLYSLIVRYQTIFQILVRMTYL